MKVWFPGESAAVSMKFGMLLVPGENEIPDGIAEKMLACGLVTRGVNLPVKELKAAKEPRES